MSHPSIVQNDRSKEQGIQEVQVKRADPATDLAERAIRQWQMGGSKVARHDLAKETEVIPTEVRAGGGISTLTIGSVGGFLGAITCLLCNTAGAFVLGVEPLRLLQIYATILEGQWLSIFRVPISSSPGSLASFSAQSSAAPANARDSNATFWRAQVMGPPSGR